MTGRAAAIALAVFKAPLVRTAPGTISLGRLEHEVIRPAAKDPRVHVALVCAARSCPPLASRAWRAADLDSMLDARMRRFLDDPARDRIEPATRALRLSRIFDWYAAEASLRDKVLD